MVAEAQSTIVLQSNPPTGASLGLDPRLISRLCRDESGPRVEPEGSAGVNEERSLQIQGVLQLNWTTVGLMVRLVATMIRVTTQDRGGAV